MADEKDKGSSASNWLGAIGSLGSAWLSSSGAKKAASKATDATDKQIAYMEKLRQEQLAMSRPQREAGYEALDAMMSMTGLPSIMGYRPGATGGSDGGAGGSGGGGGGTGGARAAIGGALGGGLAGSLSGGQAPRGSAYSGVNITGGSGTQSDPYVVGPRGDNYGVTFGPTSAGGFGRGQDLTQNVNTSLLPNYSDAWQDNNGNWFTQNASDILGVAGGFLGGPLGQTFGEWIGGAFGTSGGGPQSYASMYEAMNKGRAKGDYGDKEFEDVSSGKGSAGGGGGGGPIGSWNGIPVFRAFRPGDSKDEEEGRMYGGPVYPGNYRVAENGLPEIAMGGGSMRRTPSTPRSYRPSAPGYIVPNPGTGRQYGGPMMPDSAYQQMPYHGVPPNQNQITGGTPQTGNSYTQAVNTTGTTPENPGGQPGRYNFMADPGYNFRIQEGVNALDRSAAARGSLASGGHLRKLTRYGQDYASQEYGNVFNRIASIAGYSQPTVNNAMNTSMYAGNQAGQGILYGGQAAAAGQQAQTKAWGDAIYGLGQSGIWDDVKWPWSGGGG